MTRIRSRPGHALALATAALLGCLALAPVAAQAQDESTRLIVSLQLANTRRHNFQGDLLYNCNLFFSNGQAVEGREQLATAAGPPVGAVDFAENTGEAFVKRSGWQVEPLPPTHARQALFADLGIALQGRDVFLTARVTHGRSLLVSARRERLAIVRGAKRDDGPLLDQKGKPAPNTFSFIAGGKLKMLPAMSRALERTRCKDRRRNTASHPLKPGYELGKLTVGLRPDKAAGLAGDVKFMPVVRARGDEDDVPVAVQPAAGVSQGRDGILTTAISGGPPVPLTCEAGINCTPSAGAVGLGGGFDLVFGGRRTSVGDITLSTTGTAPDSLQRSITGTLDGAPVTISDGGGFNSGFSLTDDFQQRAGAALGATIVGELNLLPLFTRTGP